MKPRATSDEAPTTLAGDSVRGFLKRSPGIPNCWGCRRTGKTLRKQALDQGLAWLAMQQNGKTEYYKRLPNFPTSVKFEQGATKFFDGDKITIAEIRGTADTFIPGNIYWIKGTYTLASHDRAGLSAYTTAKNRRKERGDHSKSSRPS